MARFYDVAIAIKFEQWDELIKRSKQIADEKIKELVNGLLDRAEIQDFKPHIDGYEFVTWSDEDWQDDFEQIKFVMEFIKEHNDYSFIKIATDDDDEQPVVINKKHYLLGVERNIYYGT